MSKAQTQREVRQRDRFQCKFPGCDRGGEQYAHIVAEDDGGPYELDNLIFLCYAHHNFWQESARASDLEKRRLVELSEKLRDHQQPDSIISTVFGWTAHDDLVVKLGGGVLARNQERILESRDPNRPYLSLRKDDFGLLWITANFEDATGVTCFEVSENKMSIRTSDAWDIAINRRKLRFIHADRRMQLQIDQTDDLALQITGELFLNGGPFSIMPNQILDVRYRNTFVANQVAGGRGVFLAPGEFTI